MRKEPSLSRCMATNAGAGNGPPSSQGPIARAKRSGFMTKWAGIHEIARAGPTFESSFRSIAAILITGSRRSAPARCGPGARVSQCFPATSCNPNPTALRMSGAEAGLPSRRPRRSKVRPLPRTSAHPSDFSGACDTKYLRPVSGPARISVRDGSLSGSYMSAATGAQSADRSLAFTSPPFSHATRLAQRSGTVESHPVQKRSVPQSRPNCFRIPPAPDRPPSPVPDCDSPAELATPKSFRKGFLREFALACRRSSVR